MNFKIPIESCTKYSNFSLQMCSQKVQHVEGDGNKTGCLKRYKCCGIPEDNAIINGCEDKYDCCNQDKDSTGCIKVGLTNVTHVTCILLFSLTKCV